MPVAIKDGQQQMHKQKTAKSGRSGTTKKVLAQITGRCKSHLLDMFNDAPMV